MSSEGHEAHSSKRPRVGERTMLACINYCLVEDPATGLHRPRDYIQSLESRVAYLEWLLQQTRPEVATDHLGAQVSGHDAQRNNPLAIDQSAVEPPRSLRASLSPADEARSPLVDDPGLNVLSNEVALLCLSAAGREPQYFGPSSAVPFARIVSNTLGLRRHDSKPGFHENSDKEAQGGMGTSQIMEFPSPSRMRTLSDAYFRNIHPQYPFLHGPTWRSMERECLEASRRGDWRTASHLSLYFVLMVYAIGALALGGHSEVQASEAFYVSALDHVGPLLDLDNLQSVQAILCSAVYSIRSPTGPSLWKISGMAIRHCVELGYHRSAYRYRASSNSLSTEMSKRCFWVAYDIDRVASFILGRPTGISDNAIDVELPLDIDDENVTGNGLLCNPRLTAAEPSTGMTAALHSIKLRQLWSKFHDTLYSSISSSFSNNRHELLTSVESLRQELEEWHGTVPAKADESNAHSLSVFASNDWFKLAYNYSILLLYRPCITEIPELANNAQQLEGIVSMDVRERMLETCSENARDICLHYRRLYQSQGSHIQFTWGSLHILFLGGLTYLYCLWKSPRIRQQTRQTTVINTCMACTTVLVIIAERWHEAASYRDIFEVLSERTISMMCGGDSDTASRPNAASSGGPWIGEMAQLADMSGFGDAGNPDQADTYVPLQDWITELDYLNAPGDPQWLAQELLRGLRGHDPSGEI
ncbi:putative Zn(2)-C6 fungal-type domain-containing protein [Seiridium cardinale]